MVKRNSRSRPAAKRRSRAPRSRTVQRDVSRIALRVPVPRRIPSDPPAHGLVRTINMVIPVNMIYDAQATESKLYASGNPRSPAVAVIAKPATGTFTYRPLFLSYNDIFKTFFVRLTGVEESPTSGYAIAVQAISVWGPAAQHRCSITLSNSDSINMAPYSVTDTGDNKNRPRVSIKFPQITWTNVADAGYPAIISFGTPSTQNTRIEDQGDLGEIRLTFLSRYMGPNPTA